MSDILQPTYNDIHNACVGIVENIKKMNTQVDRIIGVSRGGLIPGVIISHLMDLPFTPISYSSKNGAGDNKNHRNILVDVAEKHLLIVDDICDTSLTLAEIVTRYHVCNHIVSTAVLHYKVRVGGKHIPDFYWKRVPDNCGWIIYPFEKPELL